MKTIFKLFSALSIILLVLASCGDPNDNFDIQSPRATTPLDTFQVSRGAVVNLKAVLSDESGLESCVLSYDKWKISKEIKLKDLGYPTTYDYSTEVAIPVDAEFSWKEDYQKHDGTIFKITQTYHKLSLTFYDAVRNKNIVYFYVKVNP